MVKRTVPLRIVIGLILVIGCIAMYNIEVWHDYYFPPRKEIIDEMAYFPSGRFLRIVVCDFDILFSNLVWLRAIQYYGHHALTDYNYPWLYHIFDILTQLDPLFMNGYRFGGVLISEDGGQPVEAIKLLKRAISYRPQSWEPLFDIGFIYYVIIKDYNKAGRYFRLAAINEELGGRSIRFAAQALRKAKKYKFAKDLWHQVLLTARTEKRKETALRSMRYIQIEEDIDTLQQLVRAYKGKYGRSLPNLSELKKIDLIKEIPVEPFNGRYLISDSDVVTSTTLLFDELELKVRFLNQRINAYKIAKGRAPDDLTDLVKDGFLKAIPPNPFGDEYVYDKIKGEVLLYTVQGRHK